jgi:D-alanyl-D-alanine carboxypeptidase
MTIPRLAILVPAVASLIALAGLCPDTRAASPIEGTQKTNLAAIRASARAAGAVMVLTRGSEVWRGAVGTSNRETRERMRVDRRFRVASLSKTFLAAVVLQLVAERRLALEDTVERWLPGRLPNGDRVTIRELLEHTSGVLDGTVEAQEPGTFEYANENYVLLGAIVEAATGEPFQVLETHRVFQLLRLHGTLWPTKTVVPGLARGYWSFTGSDATAIDPVRLSAADGVVSTADDIRRFLRALFDGQLLPAAEVGAMQTAVPVGERYRALYDGYGLGLMLVQTPCGPAWGNRGRARGYTSFAFASPDGRSSVVVLLNIGGLGDTFVLRVQRLVLAAFCGSQVEVWK